VVCPGRGVYNRPELGYFARHHGERDWLLDVIDTERTRMGQATVRALDGGQTYSHLVYSRGDNAASIIFACSYADFLAINRDRFDIVGVTGNSMGWYTALACSDALALDHAATLVNQMGLMTYSGADGGQVIYPLVDESWCEIPGRRAELLEVLATIRASGLPLSVSIELGGMILFAGTDEALEALDQVAPRGPGRFPMRLQNHGPFHSPLMAPVSEQARSVISPEWFRSPALPMVDGTGRLWLPGDADPGEIWAYTIGAQVVEPYNFTAAVNASLSTLDPDVIIILGPGDTLGGAVAQCLIQESWHGLKDKNSFTSAQASDPRVFAMGRSEQRSAVEAHHEGNRKES
jgi:[acyl-carrier-protein] S-malonyltransferase